ncbi:MAG: DNA alkylation repair protein [Desulfuromonas sp.]|uniref:DNA alkylation repair protein n=1 Tax=Desulfuromonas sp. TaxID=892 RepID=UPI000CB2C528|nr:DNA alkylation repair protein [Desulfuromonas sp.]PLX84844.1 MAG: DNA alkylation repair protein [Desulfuromonas sp.]
MRCSEIIDRLKVLSDPEAAAGMARFGINPERTFGVSIPKLRALARQAGRDHVLAGQLWASGIHEARILASMIDDPAAVSMAQMEAWAADFDSWDVCDQTCNNLFRRTPYAWEKAAEWSGRPGEFVKRAGFVLMAVLAVHDKEAADERFEALIPLIAREATDGRNFVKKAVNWALRQIGKRNARLHGLAVEAAGEVGRIESPSARWIGRDALRELESENVRVRLEKN